MISQLKFSEYNKVMIIIYEHLLDYIINYHVRTLTNMSLINYLRLMKKLLLFPIQILKFAISNSCNFLMVDF